MKTKWSAISAQLAGAATLLTVTGTASAADARTVRAKAVPIEFTISNNQCFKGKGLDTYFQKAITQRRRAAREGNAGELATFYVAVPSRPWRGLTVTGVGLHYESTSVYFREPVAMVRRVLRQAGVRVAADGSIPMASEEAVESQALRATISDASRFGASGVECGV